MPIRKRITEAPKRNPALRDVMHVRNWLYRHTKENPMKVGQALYDELAKMPEAEDLMDRVVVVKKPKNDN